jgi:hypothetical protein
MLKVMNLSLGRTGTMSLKYALEQLGYDKCYHFIDLFDNPEHPSLFLSASQGQKVNWEKIFEGYQSTVYWSTCYDYHEILGNYPDVKVVLTMRDPEKWYKSTYDTIYKYNRLTFFRKLFLPVIGFFRPDFKNLYKIWHLQENTLWQKTFQGKFHNKKFAIQVFKNHIEEIKSKVKPDRLLLFHVKDGWHPLCNFLDVPVPDTPFPHVNDSASFIQWRRDLFKKFTIDDAENTDLELHTNK